MFGFSYKKFKKIGIKKALLSTLAIAVALCGLLSGNTTANAAENEGVNYESVLDVSRYTLEPAGQTMQSYISGSNSQGYWVYGNSGWSSTGERAITLTSRYKYNRFTKQKADYFNHDNTGDVVFDGSVIIKDKAVDNTVYSGYLTPNEGEHVYNCTPPEGTQIPVLKWVNYGMTYSYHHEMWDVTAVPCGTDGGLLYPGTLWATWHGVEFHATGHADGEEETPCWNPSTNSWNRNSTAWIPVCAFCGEPVAFAYVYGPREAVSSLPVIEQGTDLVLNCPSCGGLESAFEYIHTCKAVSANRYHVSYNIGTADPAAYGVTNESIWYHSFATTYENNTVTNDKTVAECGFTRPGYTFGGWALSQGGTPVYNIPGRSATSLLKVQADMESYENDAVVTLYAVWIPNESYLKIDANSDAFNGGAKYNGADVWVSDLTPYQIQSEEDGNDRGSANGFKNSFYRINRDAITCPTGYTASFVTNGGSSVASISAQVVFSGYTFSSNANGRLSSATNTYKFGTEERTLEDSDVIKLQYTQKPIILPAAYLSNQSFVGWYSDPAYEHYVGTEGDSVTLTGNTTFYARFSTMDVEVTDVYYKDHEGDNSFGNVAKYNGKSLNNASVPSDSALAVWGASGAVNLSMSMFTPSSFASAYAPFYRLAGESEWHSFSTKDGANSSSISTYNAMYNGTDGTYEYTYPVESTGFYKINAYGAKGADVVSIDDSTVTNAGGSGGYAYAVFYLKEGDVLKVTLGKQGELTEDGATGGEFTKVSVVSGTDEEVLLIAGGGGSATGLAEGFDGGGSEGLIGDADANGVPGEDGQFSGGGGYQAGQAGEAIRHYHTGTSSSGGGCYGKRVDYDGCPNTLTYLHPDWNASGWGDWGLYVCPAGHYMTRSVLNASGLHCGAGYFHGYVLNCPYASYANGAIVASNPSYGGSNYINTSRAQEETFVMTDNGGAVTYGLAGNMEGYSDGVVSIEVVSAGLKDGADNRAEIIGAHMPDLAAPDAIAITADESGESLVLKWEKPESNYTDYEFYVDLYKLPRNGTTLVHEQTSDILTKRIESDIAGYYYVFSNSESTDVASYVVSHWTDGYEWNAEKGRYVFKNVYTYSDAGHHYADEVCGFTTDTFLSIGDTEYQYVAIAAVDVAGNIGASSSRELTKVNLCLITFDTNHLKYQLNPNNTVSCGAWVADSALKKIAASGENKEGYFQAGYWAVDGTDITNNNKGCFEEGSSTRLSFGGEFPTPSAKGCTFVGWNSEPDGSGLWYSASGSDIGLDSIADSVLVLSELTGSHAPGQEITLYAIWADVDENTTVDDTKATDAIQKTYPKLMLNEDTGLPMTSGFAITEAETVVSSSTTDAVWTSSSSVQSKAQFMASGVYVMNQHVFTFPGKRVASVNYYMAGAEDGSIATCSVDTVSDTDDEFGLPIWIREPDGKTTQFTSNGSISLEPDSMYNADEKNLDVAYNIQGSYKVYGTAISRSYAADLLTGIGQQGYPGYMTTDTLTLKIDNTVPMINHYSVVQDKLDNYSVDEIYTAIAGGLFTTFTVDASDYLDESKGSYYSSSDSSGIQGVYVYICDVENRSNGKYYKMTRKNDPEITEYTDYDGHILSGRYTLSANLYQEFPDAAMLLYRIYVVDNAGNVSEPLDTAYTTLPDGTVVAGYPQGDVDANLNSTKEGVGTLVNFCVKTVVYSTEGEEFNIAEGETYFQVGDFGRVEVWTIGYTDSVALDFMDMGREAQSEIKAGNLQKYYNMGLLEDGWERKLSWTSSEFVILNGSGVTILSKDSDEIAYNEIVASGKAPYAQHYCIEGWNDSGLSIRIPPYYQMTPDGDKVNKDGTPQYKWELHTYAAQASKGACNTTATSTYILWDTRANDVHYRVTHETQHRDF